jgi:hypothetical protein
MYRVVDQFGAPIGALECDACGQPINEADPGGPVIPREFRRGKDYLVRHAHAGRCHSVIERSGSSSIPGISPGTKRPHREDRGNRPARLLAERGTGAGRRGKANFQSSRLSSTAGYEPCSLKPWVCPVDRPVDPA